MTMRPAQEQGLPELTVEGGWQGLLERDRAGVEALLPGYLQGCRWFGGKAKPVRAVRITGAVPLPAGDRDAYLTTIEVEYGDGTRQTYVLPLTFAHGEEGERVRTEQPQAALASVRDGQASGVLYDASWDGEFATCLLSAIDSAASFAGGSGVISASSTRVFRPLRVDRAGDLHPSVMRVQQSNTSIVYGDRFILKLFRRLEEGVSPDLEIGRYLVEQEFAHTPALMGAIEYKRGAGEPLTLAILQQFVPNKGDAWQYTRDSLAAYFSRALSEPASPPLAGNGHALDLAGEEVPPHVGEALGSYLTDARLLGRRTAEMHVALAAGHGADPAFAPEPFTESYAQGVYEGMTRLADEAFGLLESRLGHLPEESRTKAHSLLDRRDEVSARFRSLVETPLEAVRTRVHGDYHLGQVLFTGSDFVIIDFEGEPVRTLAERRQKYTPLKDVAGMMRSFHYASFSAMQSAVARQLIGSAPASDIEGWAGAWHTWVEAAYLQSYLGVARGGSSLPSSPEDLRTLLDAYLLEKAIYELVYELNNRPDWVRIPLEGVASLIGE